MQAEFLRSSEFNKKNILENVFAPNGDDGIKAHQDVAALLHEELVRQASRKYMFIGGTATLFSLYNVSRLSQLSPSGRPAAIAGLAFFTFMTYAAATRAKFI